MILAGMGASPVRFVWTDETRNIRGMQVFSVMAVMRRLHGQHPRTAPVAVVVLMNYEGWA